MVYLIAYLLVGVLLCATVALVGRLRGKTDFTPISFVFGGGESFTFILSLFIWPVWLVVQLVEWNHSPDAPRNTSPPVYPPVVVGTTGIAHTDLKPGGKVRIESKVIDAVTSSGHIKSGAEIEVLAHTPTGVRVGPKKELPGAGHARQLAD